MKPGRPPREPPARRYRGADIPMRMIRRYARQIVECFAPERIILFGSYAYGTPHADSDVDLLVIMPASNEHSAAVKIRQRVPAPFPMDLLVRRPQDLSWRLEEGDWFLREIMAKGKVLYERDDPGGGGEGRKRLTGSRNSRRGKQTTI